MPSVLSTMDTLKERIASSFQIKTLSPRLRLLMLMLLSPIIARVFRTLLSSKQPKGSKQVYPAVPMGKEPQNKLLATLLGHLADIPLWRSDIDPAAEMFKKRWEWYHNQSNPEATSKTVRVFLANEETIFSKDLGFIRDLISMDQNLFKLSDQVVFHWERMLGPDLIITAPHDDWKRIRKFFVMAIHRLNLKRLPGIAVETMKRADLHMFPNRSQEVRVLDCFARIMFDTFIEFTWGQRLDVVAGKEEGMQIWRDTFFVHSVTMQRILERMHFVWALPSRLNRDLRVAHKRLLKYGDALLETGMQKLIADGVVDPVTGKLKDKTYCERAEAQTLIDGYLLAYLDEENIKVKWEEVRSHVSGAVFAAFDSTSATCAFIMDNLSHAPDVQDKLYSEVRDLDLASMTATDLHNLKYLNAVIKESMRLEAHIPVIMRTPKEDVVIGGYYIKKGTTIFADNEVIGQEASLFPGPGAGFKPLNAFDPDRWIDFTPAKFSFNPFGFGDRMCPGYRIGLAELQTIVGYLSQNYTLSPSKKGIKHRVGIGKSVTLDSTIIITKR